jgi:hypothetical protein
LPDAAPGPGPPKRRRIVRLLLLATVVCALGAVFGLLRPEVHRDSGLSVLLITIDTLRADALGCYGRKGAETLWIDRLAEGGVRFEEAPVEGGATDLR